MEDGGRIEAIARVESLGRRHVVPIHNTYRTCPVQTFGRARTNLGRDLLTVVGGVEDGRGVEAVDRVERFGRRHVLPIHNTYRTCQVQKNKWVRTNSGRDNERDLLNGAMDNCRGPRYRCRRSGGWG